MQIKHFVYAGIIALYGCTSNNYESRAWETAKSSTSNQTELTSFLEHYKLSGDSEKYEAACFLISNMPGKHSAGENIVYDIDVVKSDSLISSLEKSFLLKEESSFLKNYSFEQFLEYILPYRIVDEPLEYYWKSDSKRHFNFKNTTDIIEAAKEINSQVKLNLSSESYGDLPKSYTSIVSSGYGKCDDRSTLLAMALRASGIPCAYEFVPFWGSSNNGHSFVSIILPDGNIFTLPNTDIMTSDGNLLRKTPKVYRKVYSLQTFEGESSDVPELFRYKDVTDVTSLHPIGSREIQLSIDAPKKTDNYYLSVFSPVGWTPVAVSTTSTFSSVGTGTKNNKDDKIEAIDLGDGIVYLPVQRENDKNIPVHNPIVVSDHFVRELIADTTKSEKAVLKRKYPLNMRIIDFAKNMVKGTFEGANKPDFSDAEEIYSIRSIPKPQIQEVTIDSGIPYRYVRYKRPGGTFSIAEFSIYSQAGEALSFSPIACEEIQEDSTIMNVFDNNPLTYYQIDGGLEVWIGVDLHKSVRIGAISFAPRNDDNAIVSTDTYELFYWKDNWRSLGRKSSESDSLVYDNVPKNALLWLRDITKGREERPFTYENNRQIWW